jgi:phosphomannomutase
MCFSAHAGVANEPVTLTPGIAFFIGQAFALWVSARRRAPRPRISVGRDPRISGPLLESALVRECLSESSGMEIYLGI